jgi:hypothetical protein
MNKNKIGLPPLLAFHQRGKYSNAKCPRNRLIGNVTLFSSHLKFVWENWKGMYIPVRSTEKIAGIAASRIIMNKSFL